MNLGSYDIIVIVLLLHGSNFKAFVVFGVLQNQSYSLLLHVLLFFWANDFRGFALLVLEWRREQVQNPATIRWHTEAVTGFNWEQESGQWRADAEYINKSTCITLRDTRHESLNYNFVLNVLWNQNIIYKFRISSARSTKWCKNLSKIFLLSKKIK